MSHTRPDIPAVRRRPFWLAPLCALITGSPFAFAAGYSVAWATQPDPTLASVAPGPELVPLPTVEVPRTTSRAPATSSESTATTVRRAQPPPPVVAVPTRTAVMTTPAPRPERRAAPTSSPTSSSGGQVSTTPGNTTGATTPSLGSTQ